MRPTTLAKSPTVAVSRAAAAVSATAAADFPVVWPILYADIAAVSASTIDNYDEQNRPEQGRAYAAALTSPGAPSRLGACSVTGRSRSFWSWIRRSARLAVQHHAAAEEQSGIDRHARGSRRPAADLHLRRAALRRPVVMRSHEIVAEPVSDRRHPGRHQGDRGAVGGSGDPDRKRTGVRTLRRRDRRPRRCRPDSRRRRVRPGRATPRIARAHREPLRRNAPLSFRQIVSAVRRTLKVTESRFRRDLP